MLVLSRKPAERINIGDDIVVEIRRVAGNRVTLAIEAPRNIRILRGELVTAANAFAESDAAAGAATVESPYIVSHQRVATAGIEQTVS